MSLSTVYSVIAVLFIATAMRLFMIGYPSTYVFDEVYYISAGKIIAGEEDKSPEWNSDKPAYIKNSPDISYHHPPLPKFLIAASISALDLKSVSWRLPSVFFGFLSLIVLAILGWLLTKSAMGAFYVVLLASLDNMLLIHSRLAMLDIYLFFGVSLGFLSSWLLINNPFSKSVSAFYIVSWAVALSMKATAIVFFFVSLLVVFYLMRLSPTRKALLLLTLAGLSLILSTANFIFYAPSAYTFFDWLRMIVSGLFDFTKDNLPHDYSSSPYMWPLNLGGIWYHFVRHSSEVAEGIKMIGNPVIWAVFIPTFFATLYQWIVKKSQADAFLSLWYLACLIPFFWILRDRVGFSYYFLPALAPMLIMIVRSLERYKAHLLNVVAVSSGIALFVLLPTVYGRPISHYYTVIGKFIF